MLLLAACSKQNIDFGSSSLTGDPNITYLDNVAVDLATYQIDSFATSGHQVFAAGYRNDAQFGTETAGSYAEINLPSANDVLGLNVSFDSLVVLLKPTGSYYGDTLQPFTLKVRRLTQKIRTLTGTDTSYYNPAGVPYAAAPLGEVTTYVKPAKAAQISVRLSDALGQELLTKLRTNAAEIQAQESFNNYFKGLYIGTDAASAKALYYFAADSGTVMMKLYYRYNGTFTESRHVDFTYNTAKQFNQVLHDHTGTPLAPFTQNKSLLLASAVTGGKAYLNSGMGKFIKISFPSLLNLKELYPYLKIVKAELVLKPASGTSSYPYTLPSPLYLYTTDATNYSSGILVNTEGTSYQTGSLSIDELYGEGTKYTYDVTSFLQAKLAAGQFSTLALMLGSATYEDTNTDRLVLKDQAAGQSVQLKIYVLGI